MKVSLREGYKSKMTDDINIFSDILMNVKLVLLSLYISFLTMIQTAVFIFIVAPFVSRYLFQFGFWVAVSFYFGVGMLVNFILVLFVLKRSMNNKN